ncbi:bifunctional DNA-formamidopyrimidine glycosylase/DNA-(apurinic or apyrimidinic site) lyase [Sneathiella chinensis]|uniref:Formamidopyrimidine-DNA glycosylase n=1 Tax=Sneathiella chinensis TaxID=349750 RepID=A0ABQ5TZA9_9PROT|nr:bifunctional DNA-formamidopyrimidine glycosylase/DNA-(apurinic or apyrimidinic site) lyase [Sneathiella chinensis]GLQ04898.1 formamidopyrimidine-DNA glycosylase [Sneathiella chinensis]
MPELPEVETVVRGLEQALIGDRFTKITLRRKDLRFPFAPDFAARLTDKKIVHLGRRAKYLQMTLEDGTVMIGHLGMSGSFRIDTGPAPEPDKHDHIIFETGRGTTVRYHDPRRFGFMLLTTEAELATHPRLVGIGPEPLGNQFNGPLLAANLKGRKSPIKVAILDQKVVAGVGNIYACEALFRSGISPRRSAHTIAGKRAERLAAAIQDVLSAAIRSGGSTLRDYSQANGELGYFQHHFQVYDKEGTPCPTPDCPETIQRIVQAGRSTFFCPKCQR